MLLVQTAPPATAGTWVSSQAPGPRCGNLPPVAGQQKGWTVTSPVSAGLVPTVELPWVLVFLQAPPS